MKKIKFIFSILIIITTLSCETENEISDVKNSQYKVKKITKDQIISKEVIFQKIKQIEKNENQDNTLNKQVYISDLNIFIDTDSGRYLENEATGDHSYVFPIFEFNPQNNNLKNLLFDYIGNNEYDTYIVEYGFTQVEYPNLSFQQLSQRQTKFHKINLNNTIVLDGTTQSKSSSTPYQICLEVWEQVLIPNDQGEVIAGSDLWVWGETLIASECQVIGGGGGGSGNGSGGNSGGGSGQGNGGGGSGSGSTPYTGYSPIVSTVTTTNDAVINGNLVTGFVNQLGYSEKIWWNSTATTQQKVDIITLLLDNKTVDNIINEETTNFINELITLAVNRGGTFIVNNDLDPNGNLNFNNVDEFKNFVNNLKNTFSVLPSEVIDNPNGNTITKFKGKFDNGLILPVYLNTHVTSILDNPNTTNSEFSLLNVNTFVSGFTTFLNWSTDSYSITHNGNITTITINGSFLFGINFEGLPINFTEPWIMTVIFNNQTGESIDMEVTEG